LFKLQKRISFILVHEEVTSSSSLGLKEVKSQTEVLFPFAVEQLKLVSFENVEKCEKLLLQLLLLDEQFDNTSTFKLHVSVIILKRRCDR